MSETRAEFSFSRVALLAPPVSADAMAADGGIVDAVDMMHRRLAAQFLFGHDEPWSEREVLAVLEGERKNPLIYKQGK